MTAVVHGCSVHALGPILGEFTQAGGVVQLGVYQYIPLQCRLWVSSGVLPWEEHKLVAFCVGFIRNSPLECGLVSQHNTTIGNTPVQQLDRWHMGHYQSKNTTHKLQNCKNCTKVLGKLQKTWKTINICCNDSEYTPLKKLSVIQVSLLASTGLDFTLLKQ